MSGVRESGKVLAVFCADIHLSHKPPVARAAEPDWYEAQARVLAEVRSICDAHKAPLIIAGDIFDDGWRPHRCPPELINFAIYHFGAHSYGVYAIPGQHDLPLHNYEDIKRSAFWTLTLCGAITTIEHTDPCYNVDGLVLYGHPWGKEYDSPLDVTNKIGVAVIHDYIWLDKNSAYPGAPKDKQVVRWQNKLKSYDLAVFGDNHTWFYVLEGWVRRQGGYTQGKPRIVNCGNLIRRKTDEINNEPSVWLLYEDGTIKRRPVSIDEDIFTKSKLTEVMENHPDLSDFIDELSELGDSALDFHEAVIRYLESNVVDRLAAQFIRQTMERVSK